MQAFFAKVTAWLLPIILDWIFDRSKKAVEKYSKKVEKAKEQGKIDEKNLKRLEVCQDVHFCIAASRDAFNGVPGVGPSVPEEGN